MSSIAITGGATGTGVFSLLAPSTSTNRTLTLPDATGTVQVSGSPISGTTASFSGNVTLGSSVLATPTGSAPAYLCRAWVNFNGTGTPAIRASGNVSSITDLGIGQWLVNFATSMPDANYCTVSTCIEVDNATTCQSRLPATSNVAIDTYTSPSGLSNSRADPSIVNIAIFR